MKRWVMLMIMLIAPADFVNGAAVGPRNLLGTTGYAASDSDHDGMKDSMPGEICNPAGYIDIDPFAWWRNGMWVLFDAQIPPVRMGPPVVVDNSSFSSSPWMNFDFGNEVGIGEEPQFGDEFGIGEEPEFGDGFGTDEDPQLADGFGITENPVPEPSGISLFALGTVVLFRRRRAARICSRPSEAHHREMLDKHVKTRQGLAVNSPFATFEPGSSSFACEETWPPKGFFNKA